ncbi:Lipase 2 [Paramyrothecium foliicola]|nr:Lipase 2 [Paramyrothecium foliicola]
MLQKTTHAYANHGLLLECDVYADEVSSSDKPVFLFFHAGGLVDWGRDTIPPWLVQVCFQRKWPLISPSYRLLPQVGASGLVQDVSAAYAFARQWEATAGMERQVIVGGASAGFFTAALVAHHCTPPPLTLLSICGINTFRHDFFASSVLLTPTPIEDAEMAEFITGPPVVGTSRADSPAIFDLDKLLPSGGRNSAYQSPPQSASLSKGSYRRGDLYDYYIYKNAWLELVGSIDPGYASAKKPSAETAPWVSAKWPPTVIFHGDADVDLPVDVSSRMVECLGSDMVQLFVLPGEGHLFEKMKWIEDEGADMDVVRTAVKALDAVVEKALGGLH